MEPTAAAASRRVPESFRQFWTEQNRLASEPRPIQREPQPFPNPMGRYETLTFPGTDGAPLRARYIYPSAPERSGLVLMFHDVGRGVRGWHHMTRFLALGYGVLALENRPWNPGNLGLGWRGGPETLAAARLYADALTCAQLARTLPETDPNQLLTWGEGLGGALALAAAAMTPGVVKCAALNPLPADIRSAWEGGCEGGLFAGIRAHFREEDPCHAEAEPYFQALSYLDCAHFAALIACPALIGTGAMDAVSPAGAQTALAEGIPGEKRQLVYPKYGHERINFFENELLKFFQPKGELP